MMRRFLIMKRIEAIIRPSKLEEIKVDDEKSTDPLGNATPDNTIAEDKKDDLPF